MAPVNRRTTSHQEAQDGRSSSEHSLLDPRLASLLLAHGTMPSAAAWDLVEEALYACRPYALEGDEATAIRLGAIRTSFAYHLEHNAFYRRYCESAGVFPDDLNGPEDLNRIPLVPEHFFKGCPGAEEFIAWLASISSDEITWPAPGTLHGSYDDQVTLLRRDYGIQVRSTSGSSGVPSFLPRDPPTRRRSAHWKILTYYAMYPEVLDYPELLSVTLWPLDFSWADLIVPQERVHALLDKKSGLETVIRAMTMTQPRGILDRLFGPRRTGEGEALMEHLTAQLTELSAYGAHGILWAPPFLLYALARFVRERALRLELGERWVIELGGGWKLLQEQPLSDVELRSRAHQTFGIPIGQIHDIYGSTECLGLVGLSCEGGYKHIPPTVLHPLVLDDTMEPLGDGEWGRFAFLNPLIKAYPGFIVTGDRVRLWRSCPACSRTGAVLDPEISRMPGAEDRGCANIVRQLITERISS